MLLLCLLQLRSLPTPAATLQFLPSRLRPLQSSGMANIPLHCNICPKKPNFSDVSHLLTHIASKGHLSNYYKVKVRSTNEESSRQLIEAYDQWYAEWSVEELMSERMNQKDKRRTRAKPAGIAQNVYCPSNGNVANSTDL